MTVLGTALRESLLLAVLSSLPWAHIWSNFRARYSISSSANKMDTNSIPRYTWYASSHEMKVPSPGSVMSFHQLSSMSLIVVKELEEPILNLYLINDESIIKTVAPLKHCVASIVSIESMPVNSSKTGVLKIVVEMVKARQTTFQSKSLLRSGIGKITEITTVTCVGGYII